MSHRRKSLGSGSNPISSFLCHFEGHVTSLIFSLGLVFPPFKHAETVVLSLNVSGAGKCWIPAPPPPSVPRAMPSATSTPHPWGPLLVATLRPSVPLRGEQDSYHELFSPHIWFQFSKCFCTFCCREEIKSSKCKLRAERAWENSKGKRELVGRACWGPQGVGFT